MCCNTEKTKEKILLPVMPPRTLSCYVDLTSFSTLMFVCSLTDFGFCVGLEKGVLSCFWQLFICRRSTMLAPDPLRSWTLGPINRTQRVWAQFREYLPRVLGGVPHGTHLLAAEDAIELAPVATEPTSASTDTAATPPHARGDVQSDVRSDDAETSCATSIPTFDDACVNANAYVSSALDAAGAEAPAPAAPSMCELVFPGVRAWRLALWLLLVLQFSLLVLATYLYHGTFFLHGIKQSRVPGFIRLAPHKFALLLTAIAFALLAAFPAPRLAPWHVILLTATALYLHITETILRFYFDDTVPLPVVSSQHNALVSSQLYAIALALVGVALLAKTYPRAIGALVAAALVPLAVYVTERATTADVAFAGGLNGHSRQPLASCPVPQHFMLHHYLPYRTFSFYFGSYQCPYVPQFARVDTEGVLRIAPALCPADNKPVGPRGAPAAARGQLTAVTARAPLLQRGTTFIAARARAAVRVRLHLAQLLEAQFAASAAAAASLTAGSRLLDMSRSSSKAALARLGAKLAQLHPHLVRPQSIHSPDPQRWSPARAAKARNDEARAAVTGLTPADLAGTTGLSEETEAALLQWLAETDDLVAGAHDGTDWDDEAASEVGLWSALARDGVANDHP